MSLPTAPIHSRVLAALACLALAGLASAQVTAQQARLVAGDPAAQDYFGTSVAIAGDTTIIGSPQDDHSHYDAGSAYVFVRSGVTWSQQAKLVASDPAVEDLFGNAVALSGDTALVGAWRSGDYDIDPDLYDKGAAYVFVRNGATWSQQIKFAPADLAPEDRFGNAVALQGDTAVVGCAWQDTLAEYSGSAYVFVRNGTSWSQQAKLVPADLAWADGFGSSLALSGETLVVSTVPQPFSYARGALYVFVRSGTTWIQQARLEASDGFRNDLFGGRLALSGDTLITSAWGDDDLGGNSGSVYVFQRSGTSWSQVAKLHASDGERNQHFGSAVSIDGDRLAVGARYDSRGGTWAGAAYSFRRHGTLWAEEARLVANDPQPYEALGCAIAIAGDTIAIGALGARDVSPSSGAAFLFADVPAPPGPILTAVSPGTVEALIPGTARTVALAGNALDQATSLTLDGVLVPPARYTLVDSRLLLLDMPQAQRLGVLSFVVSDGVDSDSHPIRVIAPPSPRYELGTGDPENVIDRDLGLSFRMSGVPGRLHAVYISGSNLPSTNALVQLAIGNQFTSLYRAGLYRIPPSGWLQVDLPPALVLDPGPTGLLVYSQTVEIRLPAPFEASNPQSILLQQ